MELVRYPIAEMFVAPQGEGQFSGTLMLFCRTAGCCVGKRYPAERYQGENALPAWQEECSLYDSRRFSCDTNYRKATSMSVDEIVGSVPDGVKHVCITGGEPLMHPLLPLVTALQRVGVVSHIETSGTRSVFDVMNGRPAGIWLTVSPKLGCLSVMIRAADEIKLLVDEQFDESKLPAGVTEHPLVYISAVNYTDTLNMDNVQRCRELQLRHPDWRIMLQAHKIWKSR